MRNLLGEAEKLIAEIGALEGGEPEEMQAVVEFLRDKLHKISPLKDMPVDRVRWVPIDQVEANDYNPNAVAPNEMRLLHISISHDGYTQPVVVIRDEERHKYVIVDGFHRYSIMKSHPDIYERTHGMLPVVVIDKPINDRMASTVRHNRARGKHSVTGMAEMIFAMLKGGWADPDICNEIGVTPEELLRYKHTTGYSRLFDGTEYGRAWRTARMAELERKFKPKERDRDPADQPAEN
jgi:hypothetical protein